MAPLVTQKSTDENPEDNIWAAVLSEMHESAASRLPGNKNVLLLGDSEAGKTTLVTRFTHADDTRRGCGLEYQYIDIRDEYRDDSGDHTRLGVWQQDGDVSQSPLLKFVLNSENLEKTVVVITAPMSHPWLLVTAFKRWLAVLQQTISAMGLSAEREAAAREAVTRRYLDYVDPESPEAGERDRLPDEVLSEQLGLPLVFCVTKTDEMTSLEKDFDYREEHWDFIQLHLRQLALQYGAALVYLSNKEEKMCDLLFKYLLHLAYNFPFLQPANVIDKDALFIPMGYDSMTKIAHLSDGLKTLAADGEFEEVIREPVEKKEPGRPYAYDDIYFPQRFHLALQRERELQADNDSSFLHKLQLQLSKLAAAQPQPVPANIGPSPSTKAQVLQGSGAASPKPGRKQPQSTEYVLTSFFESLLKKDAPGGTPARPSPAAVSDATRDVAANLERMRSDDKKDPPAASSS